MPVLTQLFKIENQGRFLRRIVTLPLPFPNLTTWFTSTVVPLLVLFLASAGYYLDLISSQSSGFSSRDAVEVFDFIVVGGGTAGSVLANRLSSKYSVILLEAGGNPHPLSHFPTVALVTLNLPMIDWGYKTVPQKDSCYALKNNVSQWPRGKALGGCSVQNEMMYMRGNPRDYDLWADLTGDSSWNYENVLPYFKKLEDYHGYSTQESLKYHGNGGPMHIEKLRFSPGLEHWLDAGKELGYDINVDANGYQKIGFGGMDVTMKKGRRFSTYSAYIQPVEARENLKIYRYAEVTKIHFDKDNRALGVSFIRHGVTKFVRASKEVIVSAGTVNSPKLLMLSGVGQKEHLKNVGIEPRIDLPVGQNLQDHIFTIIGPFLLNKSESFVLDRDTNIQTFSDFFSNGSGPLVSIAGISGYSLLSSSISKDNYPDIYLNHVGVGVHKSLGKESDQAFGFIPGTIEKYLAPHTSKDAYFASVSLGKSKSIGEIKLKSNNPLDYPLIDPRYLSHPEDLIVMIEGIKAALNIYENTTAFQRLGAKLATNKFPLCDAHEFRSDNYWECYLRSYTLTVYHPCGSCRMGNGDSSSVVDSQLRVLKTKNLRVIDASVIPSITNTNLNAPVLLIGEKGASLILQFWEREENNQKRLANSDNNESSFEENASTEDQPVYVLDPRK